MSLLQDFAPIRGISLFFVILLFYFFEYKTFASIFFAFVWTHYTLSLIYTFPKIKRDRLNWVTLLLLSAAIISGVSLAFQEWIPIKIYFGIHFALTEAYLLKKKIIFSSTEEPSNDLFFLQRAVIHFLAYLFLIFGLTELFFFVYFFLIYLSNRSNLGKRVGRDLFLFDLIEISVVAFALIRDIQLVFELVILYHSFIWTLYPIQKTLKQSQSLHRVTYFLLANSVFFFLFSLFTPNLPLLGNPGVAFLNNLSIAGGYFHITLSFITSDLNPSFIRNLFWTKVSQ